MALVITPVSPIYSIGIRDSNITYNDLIWGYDTDWTRSASSDMRTFSSDLRMQTLYYQIILIVLNTLELLMNLSLKKTDLTRFFPIKLTHPGRLKKQIWVEKLRGGNPLATCEKRLLP